MKSTERFEKVNIDRLVPYARNARTHSKEQILQLRSSLREFGFVNPVIVDKDLNIIAGHGRIMAARDCRKSRSLHCPSKVPKSWCGKQAAASANRGKSLFDLPAI